MVISGFGINLNFMKMDSGFFWGLFLVIAGLVLMVRYVFNIEFPLFRVLTGLFFILFGLKIIFGQSWFTKPGYLGNEIIFSEKAIKPISFDKKEYIVVFGKSEIDLTGISVEDLPAKLIVNTVFASSKVYIPEGLPVVIYSDVVFGNAKLPGGNSSIFGREAYRSPGLEKDTPVLEIKLDVVFGSLAVMKKTNIN